MDTLNRIKASENTIHLWGLVQASLLLFNYQMRTRRPALMRPSFSIKGRIAYEISELYF